MYIHLQDNEMNAQEFENMFVMTEELGAENAAPPRLKANDKQIGGAHYKKRLIQPWDVVDSGPHAQAIGFYRYNALKYIMRAGDKGPAREDYEKALHYLEKLLEIL